MWRRFDALNVAAQLTPGALDHFSRIPNPPMRDIEGIEEAREILRPHWDEVDAWFLAQNQRFLEMMNSDHDVLGRVLKCHLAFESLSCRVSAASDRGRRDQLSTPHVLPKGLDQR